MDARKPTRPKLTPMTGTSVPSQRWSARSIVPSPPRTTAMSGSSSTSSTPEASAIRLSCGTASPIVSGLPCVTNAARRTGSRNGVGDPAVDVVGKLRTLHLHEVQDEFAVSLGAGQARVYDAPRLRPPPERLVDDLLEDPAVDVGVADDAL